MWEWAKKLYVGRAERWNSHRRPARRLLLLSAALHPAAEPAADGDVIQSQGEPGQYEASNDGQQRGKRGGAERIGLGADEVGVEEVEQGVVEDVERIGKVAKEAVDGVHPAPRRAVGSAQPQQDGEDHDDACGLENTVQADRRRARDVGHHEEKRHGDGSYPERTAHPHGPEPAGNEHP